MSTDLSHFKDAFFEESQEHLTTIEEGLLQLEQRPGDIDLLNRIFRGAHSIKGNSGMFGFTAVSQFTHKMESVLDQLRSSQMVVTVEVADLLLQSLDCLKALIDCAKSGEAPNDELVSALGARLEACQNGATPPKTGAVTAAPVPSHATQEHHYTITWAPPQYLFQRGLDPTQFIKELGELGCVKIASLDTSRLPGLKELDPEQCYLGWTLEVETVKELKVIEAVFDFVRDDSTLTIVDRQATGAPASAMSDGTKPLGEILVESGVVSQVELNQALSQQKRVGEILVEQKAATPEQISEALKKQSDNAPAKKAETPSIRVDTVKIDRLINLVGELVITQSMLSDLGSRFEMSQLPVLLERVAQLERNTREIQERVMGIRMVPIGNAFSRFPRLVRDLSGKAGKKIHLILSGEETELDKTVIESIGDPLTHLVRNSADHGLETPTERLAAGKPEQGIIRLNAFHEGGNICITVEDDGRGLNREKILAKGVKQGLIAESDKLSDEQIWMLIFKPGFSTADKVTDVSGRGVGMDVVKRNIEGLGGTVSIKTTAGKGTTFTLKLPLTLAIIEGMTVRVGKDTYIVPLLSILESIQPKREMIKTIVGKGELVNVRGMYLPLMRLYDVFRLEPELSDPTKAILLILETEGERVAVMVDEILGQQQVVIKSMEQNFRKIEGVAGATILGDGTVGFILDVRGLLNISRNGTAQAA
ncbi:MAG: chemotaxis protein CheA [Nitrospira sp. CR2.1]|nr:chemotaxis protein CheA [Nitrospira sp. CR2.1]